MTAILRCVLLSNTGLYSARLRDGYLIKFSLSHLQIIPIVDGALQEAFNVRLDELKVLDLAFLHGCAIPTLAVLFEDTKEQRHIKTYQVSVKDKVSRQQLI